MKTEEQCKPSARFLVVQQYFSDKAIQIFKYECIKRCKDKEKSESLFINEITNTYLKETFYDEVFAIEYENKYYCLSKTWTS